MDIHVVYQLVLAIVLAPLLGALIAGLFGKTIGIRGAHWITSTLVGLSLLLSLFVAKAVFIDGINFEQTVYVWGQIKQDIYFEIGFLIDRLTAVMLLVVTFVSFLVHIYSIGYMHNDPGYQRFFSYISMFTFAMLALVTANNFLQLFFGWEGVGLASYLLIGFWFKRESANQGSLKAFLVNRVGDFGFILAIAACAAYFHSVNYQEIFKLAPDFVSASRTVMISLFPDTDTPVITLISILLFIGAMGKSAQIPLHVWLPESMEGPTPISALIHAATMVTAGIYMVARMSPLFELSPTTLSLILIVGSTGALLMGLLAIVQFDIKRVVAYSTLSQLGYMTAALGASAYSAGIFHLMTHAAFKALLFLAAGSVIVALHHEQDMRKMGGLYKKLPITYLTFTIGSLALCALPPFSGYYSKEPIIEAIHLSQTPGAAYAYICVLLSVFVTAFYTFRSLFMTFHGAPHATLKLADVHESPKVIWIPLVLLAIPSVILGFAIAEPMLYQTPGLLKDAIYVMPQHDVVAILQREFPGLWAITWHALFSTPFWLAIAGIVSAWLCYQKYPFIPGLLSQHLPRVYKILQHKYGFDEFNQRVFVMGARRLGQLLFQIGDLKLIDDGLVNGSGRLVNTVAKIVQRLQTGYLYHYALTMILGLVVLLLFVVWRLI